MNFPFFRRKAPSASAPPGHSISEVVDDTHRAEGLEVLQESEDVSPDLSAHVGRELVWKSIRIAPFFIGMLFLMIALILEHPNLLGGFEAPETKPGNFDSVIFTTRTLVLLVAEIGYA